MVSGFLCMCFFMCEDHFIAAYSSLGLLVSSPSLHPWSEALVLYSSATCVSLTIMLMCFSADIVLDQHSQVFFSLLFGYFPFPSSCPKLAFITGVHFQWFALNMLLTPLINSLEIFLQLFAVLHIYLSQTGKQACITVCPIHHVTDVNQKHY